MAVLLAGCAMLGDPPPAGKLAGEERIQRERPWPNLADVPAEPRSGSDRAAIAALRSQLEAERDAEQAARACSSGRDDKDGKCME